MSSTTSIMRSLQYQELSKVALNGTILDLGGSKKSGYQELVKGEHTWTIVNIDEKYGYDLKFNLEDKFPLENNSYDNVISMNLIEHIFDTNNIFSETARVLKPGGMFVSAIPYMHQIHGSPDDYVRYTDSAYQKFADKYGFEVLYMEKLGSGLFSLIFQIITTYRIFPWTPLYNSMKAIFTIMDQILLLAPPYKRLAATIPLGYFWIMKKR